MSEAARGKVLSESHRSKIRESLKGREGKTHSEETKKKIGDASRGRSASEETKKKLSESLKGGLRSEETRRRMSEARKLVIYDLRTCPHCSKEGKGSNMTRYHFENCKKKPA